MSYTDTTHASFLTGTMNMNPVSTFTQFDGQISKHSDLPPLLKQTTDQSGLKESLLHVSGYLAADFF